MLSTRPVANPTDHYHARHQKNARHWRQPTTARSGGELLDEIEQDEQRAALIVAYVMAETVDRAITQDEAKQFQGGDRLRYLRDGLFLATVRYCRRSERPDIAFAVLVVVHALADNDEGACWISFGRLARLLGCSKRAIRAARERLEALGLLLITEQGADEDGDNDTNLLRLAVPSRLASVRPPASRRGAISSITAERPPGEKRRKPDA
jgi:Helix-turn-helix domain